VTDPPTIRRTIRVATFNIRHGADGAGRVSLRDLARSCAALDADVLGLQEVDRRRARSKLRDQSHVVARRVGGERVFGPALRRGVAGAYGNALVARGSIDDVEVRRLPRQGSRQPRVAILATVTVRACTMSVAAVHLQHRPRHLADAEDEAPDQLRAALAALGERPAPRVLLGDCNLQPPRAVPILTAAGFAVAETGPTYPADAPRIRLDYVAVDGARIVRASVADQASVSDHRAVVVDLEPSLR
jgi:endonuclease/exonuclease/phosphatase family metal-dependent hydrolase